MEIFKNALTSYTFIIDHSNKIYVIPRCEPWYEHGYFKESPKLGWQNFGLKAGFCDYTGNAMHAQSAMHADGYSS